MSDMANAAVHHQSAGVPSIHAILHLVLTRVILGRSRTSSAALTCDPRHDGAVKEFMAVDAFARYD